MCAIRCVHVRLVPAQPQELRRGEARERAVPGQLDQPRQSDPLLDLRALGPRALVVPEDRRPEHCVVGPERDEAVHLAREAERIAVLPAELRQRRAARLPPVLRVLLGPARLRRRERVLALDAGEHLSGRRDRDRLDAGRADVQPGQPRLAQSVDGFARVGRAVERLDHARLRERILPPEQRLRLARRSRPRSSRARACTSWTPECRPPCR